MEGENDSWRVEAVRGILTHLKQPHLVARLDADCLCFFNRAVLKVANFTITCYDFTHIVVEGAVSDTSRVILNGLRECLAS